MKLAEAAVKTEEVPMETEEPTAAKSFVSPGKTMRRNDPGCWCGIYHPLVIHMLMLANLVIGVQS